MILSANGGGEAVAVDGAGNLWVADDTGYVYEFGVAQLSSSGTPAPVVTLDASANNSAFYGLAFDPSGDLWVSDCGTTSRLIMYSPSQLATGGATAPAVAITDDGSHSIDCPAGIAFDAAGNLWVSNDANTVVRFDAGQLASDGSPTPSATIAGSSLGGEPVGLAFDASGALWVVDASSNELLQFKSPGTLNGNVAPTADAVISSLDSTDYPIAAFDPPAANLPIQTP